MEILLIIVGIILVLVVWYISVSNKLNRAIVKIEEADSGIDVALTKRYDVLTKMMDTVKAYAKYEEKTLTEIVQLREAYSNTKDLATGQDLTNKMNNIMLRAEASADLKASEQFLMLQKTLIKLENELQAARRIYNGDITLYNTTIETFPNNLVAMFFEMSTMELFTIDEYKAQNIDVDV